MAVDVEMEVQGSHGDDERAEDELGVSCSLDMFREHEEVQQMVISIEKSVQTIYTAEKAFEDLKKILDNYQVRYICIYNYCSNGRYIILFIYLVTFVPNYFADEVYSADDFISSIVLSSVIRNFIL